MEGTTDAPGPRLLCSTAPFFRQPLREAFRHIAAAGYDAVEVMVTQDPATQEPHLLRDLARQFGLSVEAIHAPFLLVTRRVWGTEPTAKVYRAVHLAESVGARLVVIHPPYRWQTRFRRWVESRLVDFSERTGVTVAVENMFPIPLPGQRSVRLHAPTDFEDVEPLPHLVLDTSHAAVAGLDIQAFFRRHHDRIRHLHLSNNAGRGWDSHLPVHVPGVLPLEDFLSHVVSNSFAGSLALELDLRPWMRDERALHDVLVRSREFCQRYLRAGAPGR
ncbi:MAG TPA: sugar phosphate isomerase/epimerase [Actinomycetota bacterium]|nr:sugar phosphate isomerase/epimerase [Actinomycetota bacterium]